MSRRQVDIKGSFIAIDFVKKNMIFLFKTVTYIEDMTIYFKLK